jgi:hypothetical protein
MTLTRFQVRRDMRLRRHNRSADNDMPRYPAIGSSLENSSTQSISSCSPATALSHSHREGATNG